MLTKTPRQLPRFILVVAAIVPMLLASGRASAGAWVQDPGACYGKLWDRSLFGSGAYSAEGLRDMQEVPRYQDHLVSLYGECGVHPWVTVLISASPAGYARAGDDETFYMGPLSAGLRVGLVREGPLRLAVAARYGYAPAVGDTALGSSTFTLAGGGSAAAFYQPAVENHLGELQLELGRSFGLGSAPAWLSVALGARLNSASGVDHALVGGAQIGATFWSRLVLDLHFALYEPFFQPVVVTNTAGVGQTRYLGFGITASYWFVKSFGAFFNLDGVFYAESNAATPSLAAGLETRFSLL